MKFVEQYLTEQKYKNIHTTVLSSATEVHDDMMTD